MTTLMQRCIDKAGEFVLTKMELAARTGGNEREMSI